MADMSLDELLSSSIKSAAEPAASAGVADAIRARVAAGDAGTTVAGSTAPGWTPPRPRWFGPLVTVVAGLAVIMAVLIGVLVWPSDPAPVVTQTVETPTPSPTTTPTTTPTPTQEPIQPPPPPRDTTAPKVSAAQWTSGEVYPTGANCTGPTTADIVITAVDETRVVNVTAATSVPGTTAEFVGFSGSAYTFRFSGATGGTGDVQVTVTFTAVDEAGNAGSASRSILFHRECFVVG